MKRLFRIGSGLFIYSIIPILSWIVLSYVMGDSRIANVFSITYAIQFIWGILKSWFGSGANIRKEKTGDENAVWNGIFWGTIIATIIFSIPLIFVNKYISFFGQDVEFYKLYVIYAIALLFLQTLFSFIIEKLYFEDKEKTANIHLFSFNLTTFVVLILTALISKNMLISMCLTLGVLLGYIIFLYVCQFKKFKIDFKFFKNFKYESAHIISCLFMLIIYLFGFKNAFMAGPEYVAAIAIVGLSTDAQWDMLDAISIVAKVDISKNRYNYKNEIKNAYIFSACVILSAIIMAISLAFLNQVSITIILIYLTFQVIDMLLNPYAKILSIFTQIEFSPTINTIIYFTFQIIRTLLSIFIISPYCNEIGRIVQSVMVLMCLIIIRIKKYKIQDGKLIITYKQKNNN